MWTTSNEYAEVVKIRLGQHGNNPNRARRDRSTQTPLYRVALTGHERAVNLFLGWDSVDHNHLYTVLNWAASEGHGWVVKMLLRLNIINSNKRNNYCLTLLCTATMEGHEGVMKVLFGWNEVNPKQLFGGSQIPLSFFFPLLNFLFLCSFALFLGNSFAFRLYENVIYS